MQRIHRLSGREAKTILHFIGNTLMILAAAILVPVIVAIIYNEPEYIAPFLLSAIISVTIGFILAKLFKVGMKLTLKSTMIFSTIIWLIACAIGALPYYLSGELSYLNAYFEAMSGFTTTGFTMYPNLDAVSYTIHFWRGFTQWIGGLGIIFFLLALLRSTGIDVVRLYLAEGRDERIKPTIKHTTKTVVYIYLLFTGIGIILFFAAGMPLFDSIFHTFSALSTGGFAMYNTSILFYNSVWIEIVSMIVMMIGATNFALHYTVLKGKWKEYFKDIETKVAYSFIILSVILVTFVLYNNQVYGNGLLLNFRFALFQIVSAITTTGFQTAFYPGTLGGTLSKWMDIGLFTLTIIMIIGAGTYSTGGGIKWLRIGMLLKGMSWQIKSFILPGKAVISRKIHHVVELNITDDILRTVSAFAFTYLIIYIISVIIVLMYYPDISRVMFEVASALGNVGLSSSIITADSPAVVRIIFIVNFWMGRLEIWPVLLFITITINNILKR